MKRWQKQYPAGKRLLQRTKPAPFRRQLRGRRSKRQSRLQEASISRYKNKKNYALNSLFSGNETNENGTNQKSTTSKGEHLRFRRIQIRLGYSMIHFQVQPAHPVPVRLQNLLHPALERKVPRIEQVT